MFFSLETGDPWRVSGHVGNRITVKLYATSEAEDAATVFHRDGFVCIRDALTPEQLAFAQQGARRVIAEQIAAVGPENMNRGYARHSFGDQIHHRQIRKSAPCARARCAPATLVT